MDKLPKIAQKSPNREEQLFDLQFDFTKKCLVQINWSASFGSEGPKLYDCSFDAAMAGLDIYVIGLKNDLMPDESSLLFYNSAHKTETGEICNKDKSIVQGENYDDYDTIISIDFNTLKSNYDKILFLIGRPYTDTPNFINWIDEKRIKKVINESNYVDCFVNDSLVVQNINYCYNQNGAMTLFEFRSTNNEWVFNINHDMFKQGLNEIIKKYHNRP
jgi:stress response protein SCP2